MRFFISAHKSPSEGHTVCILISNELPDNIESLKAALKEEFGPWMFLGLKEYNKEQFLLKFNTYLPIEVSKAVEANPVNFLYKAAFHTNYD
jgi:hypothetical protein